MANDNELIIRINGSAKNFLDEVDKVKKQTKDLENVLGKVAKGSAVAFAGLVASIAGLTKEFSNYEKALVGVGKTTNIEGKRLEKFGKEFQKLSKEIPISTNNLLGIAQAAGQLGVSGEENILLFTETIAKLGVATDLTGEQAAVSLTRILNVTGEATSEIGRLGAVIVRLGNNVAASESEIAKITTEVAKATSQFKIGSTNALAISAALAELGQQAQLGGSVVGRSFREISRIISEGGKQFENLTSITGLTGDQLKKTFEEDSTQVFTKFLEGLREVDRGGGSITQTLETLGLKGDEVNKVIPTLATNFDRYARTLNLANDEAEKQTALNEEAAKAFATLSSEATKTFNAFTNLATNIGAELAPDIIALLKGTRELVEGINSLEKSTLKNIAALIKWAAILTGVITSISTLALGALKLRVLITGLRTAFLGARLAAIGFTSAATFGLTAVIGFLPEIISGFKALKESAKINPESTGLQDTTEQLKELNKALERNIKIAEDTGKDPNSSVAVQQIRARIEALEELRKKQIAASEDFGTGTLLLRTDKSGLDLSAPIPQEQTIPFRAEADVENSPAIEATKTGEEAKSRIVSEGVQKRIDAARRENETLKALAELRSSEVGEEFRANAERRLAIEEEFAQARLIKDAEERSLVLQNLRLKHAKELEEIAAKEARIDEFKAGKREERKALEEELSALDVEQRELFTEQEIQSLEESLDTQAEAKKKFAEQQLRADIAERNRRKQEEIQFGKTIADTKAFFRKEEVQGVKSATSNLAQLQNSRNSTLKGIGKAAARVQAAISTAQGAVGAYAALAPIPIVGPALGVAAAAALVAYGVEQQARISAAAQGGFVPNVSGGTRDRVPMLLEPDELIVPKALVPSFTQAAGIPDSQSETAVGADTEGQGAAVIEIMLEDRAGEVISLEQREGRALGLIN